MSQPTTQDSSEDSAGESVEGTTTYFSCAAEWVRDYLRHLWRHRRIDGIHRFWAADWWQYDEALVRLEAMWRAWETLRLDPVTGMSDWLLMHHDPHMAVLTSPEGPFGSCTDTTSERGEPLPCQTPPPGMFPELRPVPDWDEPRQSRS